MWKPRRNKHYLMDIAEAMERILVYTEGMSAEQFLANNLIQDAVVRNLQVMGEATKKISPSLRNAHADVPWGDMAGMRDKIVHEYFGINYRTVWDVVQKDIPALRPRIEAIIQKLTGTSSDEPQTPGHSGRSTV